MLTVLMNAGPWLAVPPQGYGGIENVVATLVPELRRRGVRVVLSTVGESTLSADVKRSTFECGRFRDITGQYNDVVGIAHAHMLGVVSALREHPEIDLVHDHLEVVGPAVLSAMGDQAPPVLQTLHWDLRKHRRFYETFDGRGRVFFACVSESQKATAPPQLQRQVVGVVPLATPLPPAEPASRGDYVLALGRITPVKGYDMAARICRRLGLTLLLAGPVAGFDRPDELAAALASPSSPVRSLADVRHYLEDVRPYEDGSTVRWIGTADGAEKERLVRRARAVLFPVRWEEPGGTAVVESLALGTPVVAMRRGVMPSLIDHGVTGFLADDEEEFEAYLQRVDDLDPQACRRVAQQRHAPSTMAECYLDLYASVLERAGSSAGRLSPSF